METTEAVDAADDGAGADATDANEPIRSGRLIGQINKMLQEHREAKKQAIAELVAMRGVMEQRVTALEAERADLLLRVGRLEYREWALPQFVAAVKDVLAPEKRRWLRQMLIFEQPADVPAWTAKKLTELEEVFK